MYDVPPTLSQDSKGLQIQDFSNPVGNVLAPLPCVSEALQDAESSGETYWGPLVEVMCSVTAEVAIPDLTVRDVLRLSPGAVLNSRWRTNRDLPLRVNRRLLAFAEFDSPGDSMGVRLTEFIWEQQH